MYPHVAKCRDKVTHCHHCRHAPLNAQGTTTNNRYMLPFRTGAFLAGVPVKPIILKYSQVCCCPGVSLHNTA